MIFDSATPYKGKLSIYDGKIFIADAAVYLKATQPDLDITDPYQLTQEQFNAVVDLLKSRGPNIGEWWAATTPSRCQTFKTGQRRRHGVAAPVQRPHGGQAGRVEVVKPSEGTTGWSDTWMISSKAANPNCMYLWMNHMISPEAKAIAPSASARRPSTSRRVT